MTSRLVTTQVASSSNEISACEEYISFRDLKAQMGKRDAEALRARKRIQQRTMRSGEPPYIMDHPDWPGDEDRHEGLPCYYYAIHIIL